MSFVSLYNLKILKTLDIEKLFEVWIVSAGDKTSKT